MLVYRIAKTKYINDLTGIGAKTVGGRWNSKGVAVLYASSSNALSVLEVLAHLPAAFFPSNMSITTIELPDDSIAEVSLTKLPTDWNKIPPPAELQNIGMKWVTKNEFLSMKVPSIIVPKEWNILVNPLHPDFHKVKQISVEPFNFDTRLLK